MSNQFGIKEVLNYVVEDFVTGAPVFYADYATTTSVETTAERLDLRGGVGNYRLLSFDHTKDMVYNSSLPLVDLNAVAMITGKALSTGAAVVPKRQILYASASNTITLAEAATVGSLKIYKLVGERDRGTPQVAGTPGTTLDTWAIDGTNKIVTLNATSAPVDTAFVVYYTYTTGATAQRLTMTADKFPAAVKISGQGIWRDQVTEVDHVVAFQILRARVRPNFTLTMASTDATVLELVYDMYPVLEAGEKVYMHITKI